MVRGKMVPEKWSPGKMVPGKMVPGKMVPGKMVPGKLVPGKLVLKIYILSYNCSISTFLFKYTVKNLNFEKEIFNKFLSFFLFCK